MDKKFFVPFDTAQQLRENGYPQEGATMYYDTFSGGEISLITDRECVSCVVEGNDRHPLFKRLSELYIAAPTYHEVLDWLEEEKEIQVSAMNRPFDFWFASVEGKENSYITDNFSTRKEALNEAILKALEML